MKTNESLKAQLLQEAEAEIQCQVPEIFGSPAEIVLSKSEMCNLNS